MSIRYNFNGERHIITHGEFTSVRPGPTHQQYALGEPRKYDSTIAESIDRMSQRFTDREIAQLLHLSHRFVSEVRARYGILKNIAYYTEAEIMRIRAGGFAKDIAAELGRTPDAIKAKAFDLGVKLLNSKKWWKEWEVKMFDEGASNREIAAVTGRSMRAVRMKRKDVQGIE